MTNINNDWSKNEISKQENEKTIAKYDGLFLIQIENIKKNHNREIL